MRALTDTNMYKTRRKILDKVSAEFPLPTTDPPADLREASMFVLAKTINRNLASRVSIRIGRDHLGEWKQFTEPVNLKAAIWLYVADLVSGLRRVRRCEVCGQHMDVSGNRRHKSMHDKCSLKTRMSRMRARKRSERQ
jgi:hypothetical protein